MVKDNGAEIVKKTDKRKKKSTMTIAELEKAYSEAKIKYKVDKTEKDAKKAYKVAKKSTVRSQRN